MRQLEEEKLRLKGLITDQVMLQDVLAEKN